MPRKRSADEEREHLLKKIKRLERKIIKLPEIPEPVREDDEKVEEEQDEKENTPPPTHAPTPPPEEEFPDESINGESQEGQEETLTLDEDILNVLGAAPAPAPKKEILHKEIADRWSEILSKGLEKGEKEPLQKDNICFDNVPRMVAPKLNREVAAAMNESGKKRDQVIENRQKQMSCALSCIGQALQMSLQNLHENKLTIIKKMSDAGRLLCDSLFLDSKGRRTLVLSTINKDLKDSLLETEAGEYLFGENLTEKIKTAKAVQKSGKDLKIDDKKKPFVKQKETNDKKIINNKSLNWRGPPRAGAQQRSQRLGGPAFPRQQTSKREDRGTLGKARK